MQNLEEGREVSRHVESSEFSQILSMAMMLYSFPKKQGDALVVFPGLGETWRISQAVQDWDQVKPADSRYLLIAGHNRREKSYDHLSLSRLQEAPYSLQRFWSNVIIQPHAEHTVEQANWLIDHVEELDIKSLTLYVSPYHLLRAYCTLLKTFLKRNVEPVAIFPRAVSISPQTLIPEYQKPAWNMVAGEMERILKYQEKGDVASFEEFQKYLDWLWGN